MVIDSSAILAVLLGEPESDRILRAMASAPAGHRYMGAPTLAETRISVFRKLGREGLDLLAQFLYRFAVSVEHFSEEHIALAEEAYIRFHALPAKLNFGDCLCYALAKSRNDSLLCKGNDFKHTDLQLVEY